MTRGVLVVSISPGSYSAMRYCHSARNMVREGGRERERKKENYFLVCRKSSSYVGLQWMSTAGHYSTVVYTRLITEMRRQSLKFIFQSDNCLDDTGTSHSLYPIGPDCMPHPQGLPSETGEIIPSKLIIIDKETRDNNK